jgi:hypothetical protein
MVGEGSEKVSCSPGVHQQERGTKERKNTERARWKERSFLPS